jgi:hypothetical protein
MRCTMSFFGAFKGGSWEAIDDKEGAAVEFIVCLGYPIK